MNRDEGFSSGDDVELSTSDNVCSGGSSIAKAMSDVGTAEMP